MSVESDKLISIRQEISKKVNEIGELNKEEETLWKRLIDNVNRSKSMYRKAEGLTGFIKAIDYEVSHEKLIMNFDSNGSASAKGLLFIEEETGLVFKKTIPDENSYVFYLPKIKQ